jgi:nucleotide-binding universal stress UspA family protein
MLAIRRILVPIDWSEPSKCAFEIGSSLAHYHDAQLVVLYVTPLPTLIYGPPPESYSEHMREELGRLKPADPKLSVRHIMLEGDPAATILQVASENECDVIVIGTHGRTGLNRVFMGSVAEEVVRKAPCLVLTVKTNIAADPGD